MKSSSPAQNMLKRVHCWLDGFEDGLVARFGSGPVLCVPWVTLFIVLLVGYFIHEPWKDETQAWLMARDMTVPELWRNAGTEGHPIGWHLLAKPLTLLGLPFDALRLINIALVLTAAAVVLRAAPFRIWQRAIVIFTPPFVYFGMYARSYSLILLLCTLHAAAYASRHERPVRYGALLGAIANISVLFIPYVSLMGLWWLWETCRDRLRTARAAGILLMGVLILLACMQLIPPAELAQVRTSTRWIYFVKSLNVDRFLKVFDFYIMPLFIIIPWFVLLIRSDKILGFIALFSMSFFQFIHIFVYGLSEWHFLSCFSIMFFILWLFKKRCSILFCDIKLKTGVIILYFLLSFISIYESIRIFYVDFNCLISNTSQFISYFNKSMNDKSIAGHEILNVIPVLAYAPGRKIWSPVLKQWVTYAIFNSNYVLHSNMTTDVAANIILDECPVRRPWMLFSKPWTNATLAGYALVHSANQTSIKKEAYYVYAPDPEEDSGGSRKQ